MSYSKRKDFPKKVYKYNERYDQASKRQTARDLQAAQYCKPNRFGGLVISPFRILTVDILVEVTKN